MIQLLSRWFFHAALVLPIAALGCAGSDGGPIGTGIQTSIVGNVIDVEGASGFAPDGAAAGLPQEMLPPIEVSIDGRPEPVAMTDASGAFELIGDVAGEVTLRFSTGALSVTTELAVPVDSVVSLTDIELSPAGVEVQAVRQLDFIGDVTQADCAAGILVVEDLGGAPFTVEIRAETVIRTREGDPLACSEVTAGARVVIDGLGSLAEPGRVVALRVVLRPTPASPRPEQRALSVVGFAVAQSCADDGDTGRVAIEDAYSRTRVRITPNTSITRPGGAAISCVDIRIGDQIGVTGILSLKNPGEIRAESLLVSNRPNPDVQLRFVGRLTSIDCASGSVAIRFGGILTDVLLLPQTVIRPDLPCDQLRIGDRLSGVGRLAGDGSDAIEATRVKVRPRSSAL